MIRLSLYIKVIFCLLMFSHAAYAQEASSTAGCAELKVEFTAPPADSYYWVFGDGPSSVSTLQNPVHSYVQSGNYVAQLYDVEDGAQIGEDIIITVYPPIMIDIDADVTFGCAPLEVNFTSNINIHPDIGIEDIVWTFGDGNFASGETANYTYTANGIYTISVKVITSGDIKCDEPVIFEDFITLEGEAPKFFIDRYSSCTTPATFTFTNTTEAPAGTTYLWDFGNSQTLPGEGPHTVTYNSEGLFYPTLTATSTTGCVSSSERIISIGSPIITPTFPDTICLGIGTGLIQTTIAQDFIWDFTGTSIDTTGMMGYTSDVKWPVVTFTEPGLQTFTITAIAIDSCETTETFNIFVYQPDASYSLGPEASCADPVLIEYTADNPNFAIYTFNNDYLGDGADITRTTPTGANSFEHPDHDEYYINVQDSVATRLIVTSSHGCRDTAYQKYYIQKPEAFFIPDVVKGCVPFEVVFSDLSFSDFDIYDRAWDYGDGDGDIFGLNDTIISHTYTTTGIHEAVLTITDSTGCVDVSREVQIIAIDKITVPADPVECPDFGSICVGETLSLAVPTDQINTNLHIESDESRFDHCWKEVIGTHTYQYPGVYPINATLEFYTIFIDSIVTGCFITVEGSRSDIDYFIDCDNPYVVNFDGEKSINADEYTWYVGDKLISNDQAFSHVFDERGEYTVYLDTSQDGVGCVHRDSATIFITEIIAAINIPEKACVSEPTPLDASLSQDVHNDCHAGYIWEFENQRPREVNDSILQHSLLPGFQTITLIVEDINGCKDTISATTTAYDLQANFTADTLICLPFEVELTNLSVGDTSIVGWDWNFGASTSMEENPTHVFSTMDYDTSFVGDSITVTLVIEDALGCVDSTSFLIKTYDITSDLSMNNGPLICQNDMITFDASDYNLGGSFLTYDWDFGANGSSMEDSPTVTFTMSGEQPVQLTYTEDATGCQGIIDTFVTVTPTPVASFVSDQDSVEFICFPEQISFFNTSIVGDTAIYAWDFGNGATSDIEDPIIPFDKGTYDVQLIVSTLDGCQDTFAMSYTLVGPEGSFTIDKDAICPGEPITFTLVDPVDVSSYTWDFGDGVQIDDQSPVTHTYDNQSSVTTFTPTLIIRSDDSGCELIQDIPISVSSITADFEVVIGQCPGEISFSSNFVNPQFIEWNIDGQIITGTSNPSVSITSNEPTIIVTLNVTDAAGCEIQRMQIVDNPDLDASSIKFPNVFSPNGDAINSSFNVVYDASALDNVVEIVEFKVYDRWGELLYNNENPTVGWDGSYKGQIVPPDIYAYYIEVSIAGCESRSKKGNVTVIK